MPPHYNLPSSRIFRPSYVPAELEKIGRNPIVEWFVNVICSKNGITVNGHCIACGVSGDTCNFGWLVQWSGGKRLGIFINGILVWEETKHGVFFKIEL